MSRVVHGVSHCRFSTGPVKVPIKIAWYQGQEQRKIGAEDLVSVARRRLR